MKYKLFEKPGIHEVYSFARDSNEPKAIEIKELCIRLWSKFEPYADHHFLIEFTKDFESRFWEMDLTCGLIEHGFNVKSGDEGPDILIRDKEKKIWIEAVAPGNGTGEDKVPDIPLKKVYEIPDKQLILRFTSSINEKFKVYKGYLEEGIIKEDEPYIIAINSLKLNSQKDFFDPPRIVRTVFPFGSYQVTINKNSLEAIDKGFQYRSSVAKENLKPVSTDLFFNPEYSGISAILFSRADYLNRTDKITDSFIVVHNPYAKNPIEQGYFSFGSEFIAKKNGDGSYSLHCIKH